MREVKFEFENSIYDDEDLTAIRMGLDVGDLGHWETCCRCGVALEDPSDMICQDCWEPGPRAEQALMVDFPRPPEDAGFRLMRIRWVVTPHRYVPDMEIAGLLMVRPSTLVERIMRGLESDDVPCGHKKWTDPCSLSKAEHKKQLWLFLSIPDRKNKSDEIPGMNEYLDSIKEKSEALGIQKVIFESPRVEERCST